MDAEMPQENQQYKNNRYYSINVNNALLLHLDFRYGSKARPTLYGLIEMKGLQRLRSIKSNLPTVE